MVRDSLRHDWAVEHQLLVPFVRQGVQVMGWGNCGTDSRGRPIGYTHDAVCDHPGCDAAIDRGLSYACGGMHGEESHSCEGYYCGKHLRTYIEIDGDSYIVCDACRNLMRASVDDWEEDEDEGVWRMVEATE